MTSPGSLRRADRIHGPRRPRLAQPAAGERGLASSGFGRQPDRRDVVVRGAHAPDGNEARPAASDRQHLALAERRIVARPPPRETVARQPARRSPVLDADVVADRDEAATDRRYVGHPDLLVVVETRAFSRRGLPRGAVDGSPDERLALVEIRADRDHTATGCRRESRRDPTGKLRAVDPPPAPAVVRNPGD